MKSNKINNGKATVSQTKEIKMLRIYPQTCKSYKKLINA